MTIQCISISFSVPSVSKPGGLQAWKGSKHKDWQLLRLRAKACDKLQLTSAHWVGDRNTCLFKIWSKISTHTIRSSVLVSAKKDAERFHHHSENEVHVRPEIHGRKTRPGRPEPASPPDHILFQGFNWESHSKHSWYTDLKGKVCDLAIAGITDVWLPPPSQSVDKQGYLPSQLYNLDQSFYGNETELKDLIDELHEHGICCIADIVINHRSGWRQDSAGHWNIFEGGTPDKRLDWGPWAVVDNDIYDSGGKGHHDSGESYGAAPDLDHTSKQVQDELTDWLNWLKAEIGFDGWRFDFVKGYAPTYTQLYCERTNPTFAVGELWTSLSYVNGRLAGNQNFHRQQLCDWIDGTNACSCAFDFTTKGILQAALQGEHWRLRDDHGKPSGLIGWYPQKAVTFVDNHDTGSTQRHWNFPDEKVLLGYVYIITHPGMPCVVSIHLLCYMMAQCKVLRYLEFIRLKLCLQIAETLYCALLIACENNIKFELYTRRKRVRM
ncbi:hypothetical protein O6H91_Y267200 [Diphasiastrum complanatum]|nr:hypothetical protein O6H91_Y267200 [Diphasiastrum complanatum]